MSTLVVTNLEVKVDSVRSVQLLADYAKSNGLSLSFVKHVSWLFAVTYAVKLTASDSTGYDALERLAQNLGLI